MSNTIFQLKAARPIIETIGVRVTLLLVGLFLPNDYGRVDHLGPATLYAAMSAALEKHSTHDLTIRHIVAQIVSQKQRLSQGQLHQPLHAAQHTPQTTTPTIPPSPSPPTTAPTPSLTLQPLSVYV